MTPQELRELNATVSTKFEILSPDQMLDIQERSMEAIASGKIKQRNQTRYVVAKYVRDILNGDWFPVRFQPSNSVLQEVRDARKAATV